MICQYCDREYTEDESCYDFFMGECCFKCGEHIQDERDSYLEEEEE